MLLTLLLGVPGTAEPRTAPRVSDDEITAAVERRLQRDVVVSFDDLDVQTEKGIVTLIGTADSLLAKERAQEHAESIRGVRAVVNRLSVEPHEQPDEALLEDVQGVLAADAATRSSLVTASVDEGVVTLQGTVGSPLERELVADVVKGIRGVRGVRNETQLRAQERREDRVLEAQIRRQLEADPWIDGDVVTVQVADGRVRLSGRVRSALAKSRARYHAWTAGVREVDAEGLQVDWRLPDPLRTRYADRTDEELHEAVTEALSLDPRVRPARPAVVVRNGQVTLRGTVGSLRAKQAAEQDARGAVGVRSVRNLLSVQPLPPPSDEEIAENVRLLLRTDPTLQYWSIQPIVRRGVVLLGGFVDTPDLKERAAALAARVEGVRDVRNRIRVASVWEWRRDWEIKQDIERALFWSPVVNEEAVSVRVVDGAATLSGEVESLAERDEAIELARAAGARVVLDDLEVRG